MEIKPYDKIASSKHYKYCIRCRPWHISNLVSNFNANNLISKDKYYL